MLSKNEKFIEYGHPNGQLVIYFHGAPGAVEECSVFDAYAKKNNLKIVCFDRFAIEPSLDSESYFDYLASQIKTKAGEQSIDMIGFSIGSYIALEVGKRLHDQLRHTHLISAVAPIHVDNFIDEMAGGLVFKLAKEWPFIFSLLTRYQKLMALLAPFMLVNMFFSSAVAKDKELSKQRDFKRYMASLLKQCFQNRSIGYKRDIKFYLTWQGNLDRYTSNIYLWHGTEDNWSPFSMATYLCNEMSGDTNLEALKGLSHYSCLYDAAPKICTRLGS